MNENTKQLKARFGPPIRFAMRPVAKPNRGDVLNAELEALKERLLAEEAKMVRALVPSHALRWAAEEAASLAWLTPYPLLVLPALLDELVTTAISRARKQADIRQRSSLLQAA